MAKRSEAWGMEKEVTMRKIKPTVEDRLLSIGQAGRLLELSNDTLRRADRDGRLPAIRLNGERFFTLASLTAFRRDRNRACGR